MAVNPNIALSVRGLELPDPLEQYGKVAAIQQAQQQNALAKMQMEQATRKAELELAQRNALNRAYQQAIPAGASEPDYNMLMTNLANYGFAEQIPDIQQKYFAAQKAKTETTGAQLGVEKQRSELLNNVKRQMSLNPSDENIQRLGQQVIATGLFPAEVVNEELTAILQTPVEERQRLLSMSGAGVSDLAPTIRTMDVGGDVLTFEDRPGEPPRLISRQPKTPWSAEVAAQKRQTNAPVINMPSELAEQRARGTMLVDEYKQIRDQANSARQVIPAIQSNLGALDRGFETGAFTGVKAEAASVLSAIGLKDAEKFATDAQTFLSNAQKQVLENQLKQTGPQTESDALRISQTGAQLTNTRQANRFILKVAEAQAKRSIEQQKFYADWYRKNKTYDGAEDAWIEGEGGKSIFERPELNEFVGLRGPVMEQPEQDPRRKRLEMLFLR